MGGLSDLISCWHFLKQMEKRYSDERLKTEEAIQTHLQDKSRWKATGTMSLDNLKIRINYARKWDQRLLSQIKEDHQLGEMQFPFSIEYKERKAESDYLEAKEPDVWQKLVPALVVYPTKPYFFVSKKEE